VNSRRRGWSTARYLVGGAGLAAISYALCAGLTWCRYGRPSLPKGPEEEDALLDHFMPVYEAVERQSRRVAAPAGVVLTAACELDLSQSMIAQSLFKTRAWFMGTSSASSSEAPGLLVEMKRLGWQVLAEVPGREIVVGAVTQPWMADVVFHGVPPEEFVTFDQPDFVKIAWTLRADPIESGGSVFRTETRVATTDSSARRKFRKYWSLIFPGVVLIRLVLISMAKRDAEQIVRASLPPRLT
jgi:hypothetical protein